MNVARRWSVLAIVVTFVCLGGQAASAAQPVETPPLEVLRGWYGLCLQLVRHTPTYTPPVASRALAYLGVTAYEAVASGSGELQSLAGQLNGLKPLPARETGKTYDDAVVLQAALAVAAHELFANTGPTGQRAMTLLEGKLRVEVAAAAPAEAVARSEAYGQLLADHILAWAREDGGAVVDNMGFPLQYDLKTGPAHWVPTSLIAVQQKPLLPDWGKNRSFAMPDGMACKLPPPFDYSEEKSSEFYKQALEVYEAKKNLTPEQKAIAWFWADDAMLTLTPPGHWVSIALQILERDNANLNRSLDVLVRLGVADADAFIGCWQTKYQYDLLRPVTYIRRVLDPKWDPLINTPPFPEYPSGHSTQSAAAAVVLTALFGGDFAFEDDTGLRDGLPPHKFPSFWAAANEAAISRLYAGIHFRAAIERGQDQGRCIGAFAVSLKTSK